jgi:hypothetical protein
MCLGLVRDRRRRHPASKVGRLHLMAFAWSSVFVFDVVVAVVLVAVVGGRCELVCRKT